MEDKMINEVRSLCRELLLADKSNIQNRISNTVSEMQIDKEDITLSIYIPRMFRYEFELDGDLYEYFYEMEETKFHIIDIKYIVLTESTGKYTLSFSDKIKQSIPSVKIVKIRNHLKRQLYKD